MCYSIWYRAPTILPAGSMEAEFQRFQATGRQHRGCFIPKAVNAPEDGRNYRPKHVELIGIITKSLLLHLFGCLYYLYK